MALLSENTQIVHSRLSSICGPTTRSPTRRTSPSLQPTTSGIAALNAEVRQAQMVAYIDDFN